MVGCHNLPVGIVAVPVPLSHLPAAVVPVVWFKLAQVGCEDSEATTLANLVRFVELHCGTGSLCPRSHWHWQRSVSISTSVLTYQAGPRLSLAVLRVRVIAVTASTLRLPCRCHSVTVTLASHMPVIDS